MIKYDIHLASARTTLPVVRARAVPGYKLALSLRRFRLEQYRASHCNIAREAGGIIDTPAASLCTLCNAYCRTYLGRSQ